jgi:transcription initiation factor TFIIE subunit alpha
MLDKFLKEIVILTVGKQAESIADLLNAQKHVNEFIIAKKLELTINQTRNILYKLSDFGLVSSIRKKDKKKGWYTYFWRFEIKKSLEFLKELLIKKLEEIDKEVAERQKKVYYACQSCNLEYNEEQALLMDFTCDECGQIFTIKDDSKYIKELIKSKEKIQERFEQIQKELDKELSVIGKRREKEFKKEVKEKEVRKAEASAKRKATREEKAKAAGKIPKIAKEKIIKEKKVKKNPVKERVVKKKVVKNSSSKPKLSSKPKSSSKKIISLKRVKKVKKK